MIDDGEDITRRPRVSRLAELAEADLVFRPAPGAPGAPATPGTAAVGSGAAATAAPAVTSGAPEGPEESGEAAAARERFAELLALFRSSAVLVPLDPYGSLWTAEQNGVRWICAFSDEETLARFAYAQREPARAWEYRTVLGARLLDEMVPMLPRPAGVALDAGSPDGLLFPPVRGIVPDAAAMDLDGGTHDTHGGVR
ncbi:SseB family protein [Streptomyces sp. NPDC014779]|uniref:SseB family protein n=1 Tax=Streptomyces sp. NPDC014779 TaxID=3364911 RepID=UPI0036FEDFDC